MTVEQRTHEGPWRRPGERTTDYPGLEVADNVVTGSIRVGGRLPMWAFLYTALVDGWDEVKQGWPQIEAEYGWTLEKTGEFLSNLFEMRGEFARLLCVLADVERDEQERDDKALEGHGPVVDISPWNENAVRMPEPWWAHDESRQRVADQLRRCLATLEDGNVDAWREDMASIRTDKS